MRSILIIPALVLGAAAMAQTPEPPRTQPTPGMAPAPTGDPPAGSAADLSQRGRGTSDLYDNTLTDPNKPRLPDVGGSGAPAPRGVPTDNPPVGATAPTEPAPRR